MAGSELKKPVSLSERELQIEPSGHQLAVDIH